MDERNEPRNAAEALTQLEELLTSLAMDLQEVAGRLARLALLVKEWSEVEERR
jgi:hypothetical protein